MVRKAPFNIYFVARGELVLRGRDAWNNSDGPVLAISPASKPNYPAVIGLYRVITANAETTSPGRFLLVTKYEPTLFVQPDQERVAIVAFIANAYRPRRCQRNPNTISEQAVPVCVE
ncbi:hypothetical protein TWF788_007646 [Orbilia oligospora]|uniref:Uncharacterized protein n=1 Tax=Orbilia oligospora TaxID=2813651 RepID=A0A7C8PSD4_ORBOL|nr:hypothetical protein TWF788_007646 [Orbilia oligospora]